MTTPRTLLADINDPPAIWLDGALKNLARELLADPKTYWVGERDPKQHICWTAADRLAAFKAILAAAERVCWFDWSSNDPDASAAMDTLRAALGRTRALPLEAKGGMEKPTLMDPISSEQRISSVRPLDWQEILSDRGDGSNELTGWEADNGFGAWYVVEMYFGTDSFGFRVEFDCGKIGDSDDPDTAKAIAQDDFDRRITAALQNLSAEPVASDDASKLVCPESPSNSGSAGE